MSEIFGFDAFSPQEIARRVQEVGVVKARLPFVPMALLGLLAGSFIGFGGICLVLIKSDPTLGFAASQLLGGVVFSVGLILVIVAGAELFTGNNLLVMAWADSEITTGELLVNWIVVCLANFIGALGLACLVFLAGHTQMNNHAVAQQYLEIAEVKTSLPFISAFFRGVLCNVMVCMAVWMALAGRSVADKIMAIIPPIMVFVAAGFEHSIANMYFISEAILIQQFSDMPITIVPITIWHFLKSLVPVILGNMVGGGILVALVYHFIYRTKKADL